VTADAAGDERRDPSRAAVSVLRAALVAHEAAPAARIATCAVRIARDGARLALEFSIAARPDSLRLPPCVEPRRRDELWRHTCCELFVAPTGGTAYREFNFAPSGEWAAYGFTARRADMAPLALAASPVIVTTSAPDTVTLRVELACADLAPAGTSPSLRLGVTAVIEHADGALSYWALAHPGPQPDFHDPAGFTLALPAA
jgi:hypothetical protein